MLQGKSSIPVCTTSMAQLPPFGFEHPLLEGPVSKHLLAFGVFQIRLSDAKFP